MKTKIFTALLLFLSLVSYSQTVIEKPKIGFSTSLSVNITKVEIADTATTLHFHTTGTPGDWIFIPKETYIQAVNATEKLYIKSADGIPMGQQYIFSSTGEVNYKLVFPKMDASAKHIDYGEANDEGSWFIYDIQIKPLQNFSKLPIELIGSWFNKETSNWEVSFLDTLAIYKSQVWSYKEVKLKKGNGSIKLTNQEQTIELFIKKDKAGIYLIGESPNTLAAYANKILPPTAKQSNPEKPYEAPFFKMDSATYSGYLVGYTPRIGIKTLAIHVDDIITGKQNSFVIKIADNGFFSIKIPLYYPHYTFIRSSIYNGNVYLEPGKALFQMIDPSNSENTMLFMGEPAKTNMDLLQLAKINSLDYNEMQRVILDMTPAKYKEYCQNFQKKDIVALEAIMKTNTIGAKAYQVKKLDKEEQFEIRII